MAATYLLSFLAHVAVLALASAFLGGAYLFGNGRVVAAMAAAVLALGTVPLLARALFRGLREAGSRGQAPLWALPLAQLALLEGGALMALWGAGAVDRPDFWKDLLDVSPGPFTDLFVMASSLMAGSSVLTFLLLSYEWLRRGMALELQGTDAATRMAMLLGALALFAAIVLSVVAPTENLEYARAWKRYSWNGDADGAMAAFRRIASQPGTLADNALMRVALIAREGGDVPHALDALRELRQRFPHSPLADDAVMWTARLKSGTGDAAGARAELEALLARWPGSYLADDALLMLVEMTRSTDLEARLSRDYAWRYTEIYSGRGKPEYRLSSAVLGSTSP